MIFEFKGHLVKLMSFLRMSYRKIRIIQDIQLLFSIRVIILNFTALEMLQP